MSSFCVRCGAYEYKIPCSCIEFKVENKDHGAWTVFALSEDAAASKYIEQLNGDGSLDNEEFSVKVNDSQYYSVSVEPETNYIATKQTETGFNVLRSEEKGYLSDYDELGEDEDF